MRFDAATDLNLDFLKERAKGEAKLIFSKESTRNNRSFLEVFVTCLYGQAAEVYLIQHHNFKNDPNDYMDVKTPTGKKVEVKVTEGIYYVPYVIDRLNKKAKQFREFAKIAFIFINNKKDTVYNLEGIYDWNGVEFIKRKMYD